jgi:serine/threonine protein kinase
LIKEIKILRFLNHPNVIKLKDVYEDENYVYIVVDLLEGDELMKKYHQKKSEFDEIYISQITNNIL